MHMKGHLRQPVIDAFDVGYPTEEDVIELLGGKETARRVLGKLWNSTDTLPRDIVYVISQDWEGMDHVHSFGVLSRRMIARLRE